MNEDAHIILFSFAAIGFAGAFSRVMLVRADGKVEVSWQRKAGILLGSVSLAVLGAHLVTETKAFDKYAPWALAKWAAFACGFAGQEIAMAISKGASKASDGIVTRLLKIFPDKPKDKNKP